MSNIIRCDDVDIRKINYVKPEKVGGSYFSSINYGDNLTPLYIQTPKLKCITNISDMQNKKAPYLEIEVPNGKLNISHTAFLSGKGLLLIILENKTLIHMAINNPAKYIIPFMS